MSLTNVKTKILNLFEKFGVGTVVGVTTAAVVIVCCTAAYLVVSSANADVTHSDNTLPPDTNEQMASDAEDTLNEIQDEELHFIVDDLDVPWADMGYASIEEYWDDITSLRKSAEGMAENTIAKYSSVITDSQKSLLEQYESAMTNCMSPDEYEKAIGKFNEVVSDLESKLNPPAPKPDPKPVIKPDNNDDNDTSKPVTKPDNNGGYSTPYNFKYHGVLHETNWRWTYYSSRVLYHYMTPQWWCDENGIWRDSNGYAIVACDSKPQGTVIDTELFGKCIVMDCGVGRNDTLDLYVNW